MRHRLVLRVSTLLVAALLLLAGTFAVRKATTPARDAASGDAPTTHRGAETPTSDGALNDPTRWDGALAFDTQCASCHAAGDIAADLRAAPDPARHVLRTLEFLGDHWTDSDAQRLAILRHVLDDG